MLSTVQFGDHLQIAAVVAPIALYFLVLGLLNTRKRPQLLRSRVDFALLLAAMSPLVVCPLLSWLGATPAVFAGLGAAGVAVICLLSPPRASWVVYNVSAAQAANTVKRALAKADIEYKLDAEQQRFQLPAGEVQMSGFPLLRNVSIRMTGCEPHTADLFERALAENVESLTAQTTPAAMAMLLVATAMFVAPLVMAAPKAVEIVRIITGLLY